MSSPAQSAQPEPATRGPDWRDGLAAGILALLAAYLLAITWRKWPDPLIDVGAQLYVPWRVSEGAVLYRDIETFYGPFSIYVNSVLFRILGASLNTFIAANLVVYGAIVFLIHRLLRLGWGRLAAFTGTAVFIGVFSFSRFSFFGGYNYVTPYSQETTHGMLQLLLLITALRAWLERPSDRRVFLAGLIAGLAVLLKPEFILASAAIAAGAFALSVVRRLAAPGRSVGLFVLGGVTPVLAATLLFFLADATGVVEAWSYANHAWLVAWLDSDVAVSDLSQQWLGLDAPVRNLLGIVAWGGTAAALGLGLGWLARKFPRVHPAAVGGVVVATGLACLWAPLPDWARVLLENIGYLIPGLLVLGVVLEYRRAGQAETGSATSSPVRVMLVLAAFAMLARMILNPRIHHYGYFQAALGGVVAVATLVAAIPLFLQLSPAARRLYHWVIIGATLTISARIAVASRLVHRSVVEPVAPGTPDAFYALAPLIDPTGELVEAARQYLVQDTGARSLLVLPEGAMLNYLTRIPSSISQYLVFVPAIGSERMDRALEEMEANPPDRIALITRSLTEYGVENFGDSEANGAGMIRFLVANYGPDPVFSRQAADLNGRAYAVAIFARRD